MGIKYELAEDIMARVYEIVKTLGENAEHVRLSGVYAIRSRGSGSRGTIARCHALSKIWQLALGIVVFSSLRQWPSKKYPGTR